MKKVMPIINKHYAVKNRTADGEVIEKLLVKPSPEDCEFYFSRFHPDAEVLGVRECDSKDIGAFHQGIKLIQPAPKDKVVTAVEIKTGEREPLSFKITKAQARAFLGDVRYSGRDGKRYTGHRIEDAK